MTTKKWFKPKYYGWGWRPASWEGWLCFFTWLVLILADASRLSNATMYAQEQIASAIVAHIVVLTLLLIAICVITGAPAGWHWAGRPVPASYAWKKGLPYLISLLIIAALIIILSSVLYR